MAIARSAILEKFRGMIDRGEPIIGGGADPAREVPHQGAGEGDLVVDDGQLADGPHGTRHITRR